MRIFVLVFLTFLVVSCAAGSASAANPAVSHPCASAIDQSKMTPEEIKNCYARQPMYPVYGSREADGTVTVVAIGDLVPFTEGTNYMSIAGYLRWLAMKPSA